MMETKRGYVTMPDGAKIACWLYAAEKGPETVVLLHGNGEDHHCFDQQIPALAARYQVLAIDSRGHGKSTDGRSVTISAMADDLSVVLKKLAIPRASVVGFSDGGNVALHFALRYPSQLEKLVLAGANLYPSGVALSAQLPDMLRYYICRACAPVCARARKKAEILGLMVEEPHFNPRELERIFAPTLVMAGDADMIRPRHTLLIARAIPGASLTLIPHSDHFIFRNRPDLVNRELLHFLR